MKKYLLGKNFFVYTDHKPLLGLFPETKGIQLMAVLSHKFNDEQFCYPLKLCLHSFIC